MSRPDSSSSVPKSANPSVSCAGAPVALDELGSVLAPAASGSGVGPCTLRAVLTRPADRQHALKQHLQSEGWDVMSLPALNLVPTGFAKDASDASDASGSSGSSDSPQDVLRWQPAQFDWVMFVSRAAWQFYRGQIGPHWPASTGIAVVGKGTARIIAQDFEDGSVRPESEPEFEGESRFCKDSGHASRTPAFASPHMLMPEPNDTQDSEGLWRQLASHLRPDSRVLIVAGDEGRPWMRDHIRAHGAHCEVLTCYRRVAAPIDAETAATLEQWVADRPIQDSTSKSGHHFKHDFAHNDSERLPSGGVWLFTSRHSIKANRQALNEAGLLGRIRPAGFVVTHERLIEPVRLWLKDTGASPDMAHNTPVWVSHPDDDSLQATFARVRAHLLKMCTTDARREA